MALFLLKNFAINVALNYIRKNSERSCLLFETIHKNEESWSFGRQIHLVWLKCHEGIKADLLEKASVIEIILTKVQIGNLKVQAKDYDMPI